MLIASNRGPVSFAVGDDGSLVARRGAGGLVSGLSSVKDHADVLWVCAALSDADRAAARSAPDGCLDADLTPAQREKIFGGNLRRIAEPIFRKKGYKL